MLTSDQLKQRYEMYLDRCEKEDVDSEEIKSLSEFIDDYYSYLENEGGY